MKQTASHALRANARAGCAAAPADSGRPKLLDPMRRVLRTRHVLAHQVDDLGEVIRARKPKRLPVVMTREEVKSVPASLTGEEGRHHVDESIIQKAVNGAVRKAGLTKRACCRTFRHPFATRPLEGGYEIRTGQVLLGHNDLKTTTICAHDLSRGPGRGRWTICRGQPRYPV